MARPELHPLIARYVATRDASNALFALLTDMGARIDPSMRGELFDDDYGRAAIRAYSAFQRESEGEVFDPDAVRMLSPHRDLPQSMFARKETASSLAEAFDAARRAHAISGPLAPEAFERAFFAYLRRSAQLDPDSGLLSGAALFAEGREARIPTQADYVRYVPDGLGVRYAHVDPRLITDPLADQIYLEQLAAAVEGLTVADFTPEVFSDLLRTKQKLVRIVADLQNLALDNGAIAAVHTERIQGQLFDRERDEVTVMRMHLNMTGANKADPSERLGNLFLEAVKLWLIRQFPGETVVQSPERTTFQAIVPPGIDLAEVFDNFSFAIKDVIFELNEQLPARERVSTDSIDQFIPRAVATALPLSRRNLISYAIREEEDVDLYHDVLAAVGFPEAVIGAIRDMLRKDDGNRITRPLLRMYGAEYDKGVEMLASIDIATALRRLDTPLKLSLQALLLTGVHRYLRYLAGATTFFEKYRGGLDQYVSVFTEVDIPRRPQEDYNIWWQFTTDGTGFVSDGVYDVFAYRPELADPEFIAGLPHLLAYAEDRGRVARSGNPEIDRILATFPRRKHQLGQLSHRPRKGISEALIAQFQRAFAALFDPREEQRREGIAAFDRALASSEWRGITDVFPRELQKLKWHALEADRKEVQAVLERRLESVLDQLRVRASPGGQRERLFRAISRVRLASSPEERSSALELLKREMRAFAQIARGIYAQAVADPKYPLALKPHAVFLSGSRTLGVDVFRQELARAGYEHIAVMEYDSFRSFQLRNPPAADDALFQSIRDQIYLVASDWGMPIPIMTPSGGDLVTFGFADADGDGIPVDPGAFIMEIQRRVEAAFRDRFYPDTKKVQMVQATIAFREPPAANAVVKAVQRVADRLHLQTIPSVSFERGGTWVLSAAKQDEWSPSVTLEDVARELMGEEGLAIESIIRRDGEETMRLPIWMDRKGEKPRYRFGSPEASGMKPFLKSFTMTGAVGRIDAIRSPEQIHPLRVLSDRLGHQVDALKDEFFPTKGGLGFDQTLMPQDRADLLRLLERQETAFLAMHRFVLDRFIEPVIADLSAVLGPEQADAGAAVRVLSSSALLDIQHRLAVRAQQVEGSARAFKRMLGQASQESAHLISRLPPPLAQRMQTFQRARRISRDALLAVAGIIGEYARLEVRDDASARRVMDAIWEQRAALMAARSLVDSGGRPGGTPPMAPPTVSSGSSGARSGPTGSSSAAARIAGDGGVAPIGGIVVMGDTLAEDSAMPAGNAGILSGAGMQLPFGTTGTIVPGGVMAFNPAAIVVQPVVAARSAAPM